MKKKLAILIQRAFEDKFEPNALVKAFKNDGWEVDLLCIEDIYARFDQDGDHFIHFTKGDINQYDVMLVREVFMYSKYTINIVAYLRNKGKLVIDNNLSIVRHTMNKIVDGQKIVQAGLPYPKSIYSPSYSGYMKLMSAIDKEIGYPLLLKHKAAGKGASIFKMNDRLDLENKLADMFEEKAGSVRSYYVQEMVDLEADYRVLVIAKKVVGAMQRIPKKGEFRANFSLGGSVKPVELTEEMKDIAGRAAAATDAEFAGVDIIYTKDKKPYLLEVNRTPGFEGFMKAHGIDIPQLFVDYLNELYNIHTA